ncbi:MAG: hypothetical protein R3E48_06545 [Burkholderiaceae bacterium]
MLKILRQASLRAFNTFGVEAEAHELAIFDDIEQRAALIDWLGDRRALPIGGGSNLLLTRPVAQPVVLVRLSGRRILSRDGDATTIIEVAAASPGTIS